MNNNITLPRAVGEQVREALVVAWQSTPVWQIAEARNALDAALAEPDAALEAQEDEALLNEPIAMRYDGDGYGYLYIDSGSGSDWQRRHKDAEPLYLAPPKPDAKPEPVHIHTCGPDCQKPLCVNRRREIAAAVEAEREACAEICDAEATIEGIAQRCAANIRARGSDGKAA
jgi:hypothetical protein